MSRKTAKTAVVVDVSKKPKSNEPLIGGSHPLAWRFSHCDKDGPFGWARLCEQQDAFAEVLSRLSEFETKNWTEITATGSHPIDLYKLSSPAQDRIQTLKMDDLDQLMSFRITGDRRVWCVQHNHIMRILWWDPDHQVYPTPKDKNDRAKLRNQK